MKRVLLLCDVDGVVAPMPWEKTVKAGKFPSELEFALGLVEWEHVRHEADPETHFPLDSKNLFEFIDGLHPPKVQIEHSSEMMARLRKIGETPGVDFRWCTMWNERAAEHLNPLFGTNFPVLQVQSHLSDLYHWHKWYAIQELLDRERENYDALVWLDDQHNEQFVTEPLSRAGARKWVFARDYDNLPALVLQTDPRFGPSREEMARVEEFVAEVVG